MLRVVKSWRGPTHWLSQGSKSWGGPVSVVVAPMIIINTITSGLYWTCRLVLVQCPLSFIQSAALVPVCSHWAPLSVSPPRSAVFTATLTGWFLSNITTVGRVATHLGNLEKSGNLSVVREKRKIQGKSITPSIDLDTKCARKELFTRYS